MSRGTSFALRSLRGTTSDMRCVAWCLIGACAAACGGDIEDFGHPQTLWPSDGGREPGRARAADPGQALGEMPDVIALVCEPLSGCVLPNVGSPTIGEICVNARSLPREAMAPACVSRVRAMVGCIQKLACPAHGRPQRPFVSLAQRCGELIGNKESFEASLCLVDVYERQVGKNNFVLTLQW